MRKVKLGDILKQYRIEHWIDNAKIYKQVTITKEGQVFLRGEKIGLEIGRKRQFVIDLSKYPHTLLFIRQTIWDGGIGVASPEVHNCIVTENFPMFEILESALPAYLQYYFRTNNFYIKLSKLKIIGSAQKAIHERDFLSIEIDLPTLETQKEIVARLDHLQQVHQNALRTLAELQKDLKALRQSLLQEAISGKLTCPNAQDFVQYPDTPFPIPKHWRWETLGDLAEITSGSTPNTGNIEYYKNGTIHWVTSGQTGLEKITQGEKKITEKAVKDTRLKIYPPHTLIFALYGQGKTRGQVSELHIEATLNQACAAISLHHKELKDFIKIFLKENYHRVRLEHFGGSQPNFNGARLKNILIPLPPLAEQSEIVAKVEAEMQAIGKAEAELAQITHDVERYWRSVLQGVFRF